MRIQTCIASVHSLFSVLMLNWRSLCLQCLKKKISVQLSDMPHTKSQTQAVRITATTMSNSPISYVSTLHFPVGVAAQHLQKRNRKESCPQLDVGDNSPLVHRGSLRMLPELGLGKVVFPLIWEFLVYPDLWTGAYTFIQENIHILPQIKEGPYGSE